MVARRAHNPEVVGSNPTPAIKGNQGDTVGKDNPSKDDGVQFSDSIKEVIPENLLSIEVYHLGFWAPLMIGDGIRVCVPNIEAAEKVIKQFNQCHIAKARPIPPTRWRPLSKMEQIDFTKHLQRHGIKPDFGTNIFQLKVKDPELKKPKG